jgi:hypothetical protein
MQVIVVLVHLVGGGGHVGFLQSDYIAASCQDARNTIILTFDGATILERANIKVDGHIDTFELKCTDRDTALKIVKEMK